MIEPYRGYILYCDICDHEEGPFEWLDEAEEYRDTHGWKNARDNNMNPVDICPECRETTKGVAE